MTQAFQDLTWDRLLELRGILQIMVFNLMQIEVSYNSIPNSYLNMESGKDLDAQAVRKVNVPKFYLNFWELAVHDDTEDNTYSSFHIKPHYICWL